MDWDSVKDFLDRADTEVEIYQDLFTSGKFKVRLRNEFLIQSISPASSASKPLLQLADLFAGLSVFSRTHYDTFETWRKRQEGQISFFASDGDKELTRNQEMSRSMRERCHVLQHFDRLCKSKELGVSLRTRKGLWTPDPENPINFWPYEPQHPMDKAPTRK